MFLPNKPKKKFSIRGLFGNREERSSFKQKYGLQLLNVTQFLGALNDNVFKFLTVFLLIDLKGVEHSAEILFWIGVVYVLPFLLFSSSAGILADRFSKQKIIISMKVFEIFVILGGIFAFYTESPWACYTMLFMLSFQSAIFGPPKYSIIPELVPPEHITKANGLITSSTYMAIILGSFSASFVTQITGKNFLLAIQLCMIIAVIGCISAFLIPKTVAKRQKQKITPFFIRDIYRTLKFCATQRFMLLVIFSSSFFLFIGAFIQLNIVPYAIESLGLSEVGGGYLFLAAAIGIALGAVVAGRTSSRKGNLGLSCLAIGITASFFIVLSLASFSIIFTVITLVILGFGGGLFIVPLDSYIQANSPDDKRGKIIAANNFFSFVGVWMAPICLYLFSGYLRVSNAMGFALMGVLTYGMFLLQARKLSGIFLNYTSRKLLHPFFHVDLQPANVDVRALKAVVIPSSHWTYTALIMGIRTRFSLYIAKEKRGKFDFVWNYFTNIHFIYYGKAPKYVLETFSNVLKMTAGRDEVPCLVLHPNDLGKYKEKDYKILKEALASKCQFAVFKEVPEFDRSLLKVWKRYHIALIFDSNEQLTLPSKKKLLGAIFSK